MIPWSLRQFMSWLWLLFLFELCCGQEASLITLDPEGFEQRALQPGVEKCKALHNELVLAAESLSKSSDVSIYEIDCLEHEKFCASLDVLSFPTIRTFEHQKWSRYRGPQRATPLVTHVLRQVTDSLVELDENRFAVMKNLDIPLMVLSRAEDDVSSTALMTSLAREELAKDFFVGVMSDTQSEKKNSFITVYNVRDETTPKYDGPFEKDAILHFAGLVSQPLIRQFDMSSLVSFMKSGLPIGMIYSAKDDERQSLAAALSDVAMGYRGKVNFATVDAIKNSFALEPMGLNTDELPAFVIQINDKIYKFGPGLTITPKAIDAFLKQTLFSGTGQPDWLIVQPT
ncbi:protein disulfide isomerase, putative [Talaromyces marneffei ATCC 18224]|uniref:Protein disulfide-isomerase n=1 Tax=Talaromyces marneffei (strain ATCC 18224 / CBS 334.59 / QM 7333) TaxID=441960 RepID=B6QWC4_TALMQ|nr:protein disulfide isomerase, putative [Talaromyces marneffei ATCC 18224]